MQELPWFQYSDESVDELLALEGRFRTDALVLAFEEAILRKEARVGTENLTYEERIVLAVESLEREVNNGGYDQFFVNTMEHAPMIVDALRRINCPITAQITQRAIDALRLPSLTVKAIEKIIYDDDDARDALLGDCDDEFFPYPERIEDRLFEFIKCHKDRISLGQPT